MKSSKNEILKKILILSKDPQKVKIPKCQNSLKMTPNPKKKNRKIPKKVPKNLKTHPKIVSVLLVSLVWRSYRSGSVSSSLQKLNSIRGERLTHLVQSRIQSAQLVSHHFMAHPGRRRCRLSKHRILHLKIQI